jgi:polyhydroxyalkanoate synthesis regulator protein
MGLAMQIGVDYYLETDVKKASYFQKKLNGLVVKSLSAPSVEQMEPNKQTLSRTIRNEMNKFMDCRQTYVQSMVEMSLRSQKKLTECVRADLDKQEELFQHRKLRRVKSSKLL